MEMNLNKFTGKNTDEEFENFVMKVETVSSVIKGLASNDNETAELAARKADCMLGNDGDIEINEDMVKVKSNKTVINQQAFDEMPEQGKPHTMNPDAFKKSVERDSRERYDNRRMRKEVADGLMKRGNKCFREKEFEKALSFYNQAITEVADSGLLFTNRALTCLHLKLYKRVIADCDKALRLNENNMKALLYKARALMRLGEEKASEIIVEKALNKHSNHADYIKDYISRWNEELF